MKRLLLLFLSTMAYLAMIAGEVTEEQALQKAQQFMQGKEFVLDNTARRSSQNNENAYYIFNVKDNGGFVIVAGNGNMPDILGYSNHGSINEEFAPCGLKWLLGCYKQMAKAVDNNQPVRSRRRTAKASIAPFITTAWGQGSPYNSMCPEYNGVQCPTGCVATAMAQVINYCHWPIEATTSIPSYITGMGINVETLNPTLFDWYNMTTEDVARLMRYCGQSITTDYGPEDSGAQPAAIPNALINVFGYTQATHYVKHTYYDEDEWENLLYHELSEQRPILYDGYAGSLGHSFVVHGYDEGLFYVNWGWNGEEDGYFLLTGLTTNAGSFNSDQGVTIGIRPPSGNESPRIVVKAISTGSSKFMPRDDSGNISGIQVNCTLASDLSEQKTMQIGIALYSDDSLEKVLNWESHEFPKGEIYDYNTSFDITNDIPNGVYRVIAVWRESESDNWKADANSSEYYLEITLDDERTRIRTFPMSMDERQTEEVVTSIDGITYCLKTTNSLKLATVMNEKKHKLSGEVYIPEDVEYNGIKYHVYDAEWESFSNCPELTSLSTAMTRFPGMNNCNNIVNLELREGVTFMESGVESCALLESIELPKSVIYVSQVSASSTIKTIRFKNPNTFDYQMSFGYPEEWVSSLTDIFFASPFAPILNLSAIEVFPVNSHVTLHVPMGAKSNYEAGGWQGWNIVEDQPLPTEQTIECGYCTGTETAQYGWIYDSGNNNGEFAIRVLPEMLASFIGKTINRIRFKPAGSDVDYVFISSSETDYIVKQPVMGIIDSSWNDVFLSEPFTITGDMLYIGFGIRPSCLAGAMPAVNEDPTDEGYWYRAMGTDTSNDIQPGIWKNLAEREFYRPIPLKFYVSFSGEDLLNDLAVNKASVISKGDNQYTFKAKVTNRSPKTIENYTIAWDIDGEAKGEKTFQTSLVNNQYEVIEFDVSAILDGKNHHFNYVITSVNDQPDDLAANSSGAISFIAAKTVFPRKIVMEEATATECGSCVRGIEIIDRLSKEYPDNFIPISIHNYGEMNTENYEPIIDKFPMMPNSLVNRTNITDAMIYDQVMETFKQQKLFAEAMIKPTANFTTADSSYVTVTTESVFGFSDPNSSYRIAYVVVEDNVGPFMQSNDYSNPSADHDESDIMDSWVHKSSQVEMVYNNVACAIIGGINGVEGSVPATINEGETYKYSESFKLPNNIHSKNDIRIVTLLIDQNTGEIINAAKVPISPVIFGDVTGSGSVDVQDATIVVNYILGDTSGNYDFTLADMNNDGVVDVFDVQAIINVILSSSNAAPIRRSRMDDDVQESICLSSDGNSLHMGVDNAGRFTSLQFNIKVPQGVELLGAEWDVPVSDHMLQLAKTGENCYTVVALSMNSTPLPALGEKLLKLRLSDTGNGEVSFSNIMFVTPQGEATYFNESSLYMTTRMKGITYSQGELVYDLSGRQLNLKREQLPKGIYIINNTKVVIK